MLHLENIEIDMEDEVIILGDPSGDTRGREIF